MLFKTVEYRRLHSFGEYENETVGVTAEVQHGELAEEVLQSCKIWVEHQFTNREKLRALSDVQSELNAARSELARYTSRIKRARATCKQMADLITKHGGNPGDLKEWADTSDLPF